MLQGTLSQKGLTKIFDWETGGKAYYNHFLSRPNYPGGESGVTIGGGYDLGYNTPAQIRKDWEGKVTGNALVQLIALAGIKGLAAKAKITPLLKQIVIPYEVAYDVFINSSVPRFYKESITVFQGLEKLNADTQTAILSVVFNRGNSLTERTQQSILEHNRREMKALVGAIAKADYTDIAKQIENMKRLWDGIPDFEGDKETKLQGLVDRRIEEAALVRQSIRAYAATELVQVAVA